MKADRDRALLPWHSTSSASVYSYAAAHGMVTSLHSQTFEASSFAEQPELASMKSEADSCESTAERLV